MPNYKLLMIPGPIEFDPAVLQAMGAPTVSHLDPAFLAAFGRALELLRDVVAMPQGQPFVVAGSGTLAMDMAAANLVGPGDRALVVNTGYFSDRFAAILERYGAAVEHVRAAPGDVPALEAVEAALRGGGFKLMTVTHVDTSTAVRADVRGLAGLGRQHGVLTVVDGVCSVAGEELWAQEWGVDVILTASQKAVGVPPGLALLVASPRAMESFCQRRTPVQNYYADWANWLPIMEAYEARRPSYFGTPAVNLIAALEVSLGQILAEGLPARFSRHRRLSAACKAGVAALGLGQLPSSPAAAADTLTAPYYPPGVGSELVGYIKEAGVVVAGGLHPDLKARYFRIGHIGIVTAGDILATIGALEQALARTGHSFEAGAGVQAVMQVLMPAP